MEAARWIIVFVAAVTAVGGLSADWFVPFGARQHLKNPLWKPHAKFHNAQGILMGFLQGLLAIGLLFVAPLSLATILLAALIASLYWGAMMVVPIFPDTAWVDPEFDAVTPRPLGLYLQQLIGYMLLALVCGCRHRIAEPLTAIEPSRLTAKAPLRNQENSNEHRGC